MKRFSLQLMVPVAEVIAKIISFINILIMIKILPMSGYADYSYIVAIVLWTSILMDAGMGTYMYNRSLKGNLKQVNLFFSSRLFISVVFVSLLALFFIVKKPEILVAGILFSIVIYFNISINFVKLISRGNNFYKVDITSIILEPILRLAIFLIAYFLIPKYTWTLINFMTIYLIAGALAFIINYSLYNNKYVLKFIFPSFVRIRRILIKTIGLSRHYLIYFLIYVGISRLDIIFLESYSSKENLAIFASARTIYDVILLFFVTIITSYFKTIYNNEKKSIIMGVISTLVIVTFTLLLSELFLKALFPPSYHASYLVLNKLILALLPSVLVYYLITKLNFKEVDFYNSFLLLIPFIIKLAFYLINRPYQYEVYAKTFVIIEYLTLVIYLIFIWAFYKKSIIMKK